MNKHLRMLAAGTVMALFGATQAHAIAISLAPSSQNSATGGQIAVEIIALGLTSPGPVSVSVYDFSLGFDAAALALATPPDAPWTFSGELGFSIDESRGLVGTDAVHVGEFSLEFSTDIDGFQSGGDVVLATVLFDVIDLEPGDSTTITMLSELDVGAPTGIIQTRLVGTSNPPGGFDDFITLDNQAALNGGGIQAIVSNPLVIGTPEPATALLLGLGLLGLGRVRRHT